MPASLRCFDVSPEPAANRLLRALAVVLERFGGRWYVFGAQAVIVWGQPRLTADVDVTCFLEPEDPEAFVTSMKEADFSLRVRDVVGFIQRTRVLPFVHGPTQLALDVVLAGPGLEEEFLRTAKPVDFEGTRIPVIGAESPQLLQSYDEQGEHVTPHPQRPDHQLGTVARLHLLHGAHPHLFERLPPQLPPIRRLHHQRSV